MKYQRESEFLRVHVDPGMRDGHEILQFEEGEPLIDGEPGDLKVSACGRSLAGTALHRCPDSPAVSPL